MDDLSIDWNELYASLRGILQYMDPESLQKLHSAAGLEELQELLLAAAGMVSGHLSPEEREKLSNFIKSLIDNIQEKRKESDTGVSSC